MQYNLNNPLKLDDGSELNSLTLDFDSLSFMDLKNAKKVKAMLSEGTATDQISNASQRLDPDFRIGIAWIAAVKGTKGITLNDVLNLSARDAMELGEVALSEYCF